ncbi:hypothetical protein ES708_00061 [subsurface metagenome]
MGVIQNIELKVVDHSVFPGRKVFECWRDGVFIAAIYPHQDGLRIVSKYMTDLVMEEEPTFHGLEWLPSAIVKLGEAVTSS